MSAMLLSPPLPATSSLLCVERTDIECGPGAPGQVAIAVTVRNLGDGPSAATQATIQAAPLGAFLPWQPLAQVQVPSLEPGESHVIRLDAARPATKPLGPPDRVPPRRLLTALGFGDRRRDRAVLPADPLELLGRTNTYWAGNLNVFVGGRAVERHLAQALRVYPGRTNLAIFMVGSRPDAYAFRLKCAAPGWQTQLHDMNGRATLMLHAADATPIATDEWLSLPQKALDVPGLAGTSILILALVPPEDCGAGTVEVQVTQRSTGQVAVVEFSLDPRAAGPGCYVV
jgi:hypothetical protein